ncbi:hypothetical protein [Clostridium butyricum]|uniref:hypothetical protein n=1 Tax=Clostridium butyricum TaxID=1492 RepID=UPI000AEBBBAA
MNHIASKGRYYLRIIVCNNIKYILLSFNKDKGIFEAEKALNISFSILGGIYMIEIT